MTAQVPSKARLKVSIDAVTTATAEMADALIDGIETFKAIGDFVDAAMKMLHDVAATAPIAQHRADAWLVAGPRRKRKRARTRAIKRAEVLGFDRGARTYGTVSLGLVTEEEMCRAGRLVKAEPLTVHPF